MGTGIRDFCVKYNERLKNDKDIKENELDFINDYRDRISFNLNVYISGPNLTYTQPYHGENLFKLDKEDLEYLYKKYSKKVEAEMEQNIAEVKGNYENVFQMIYGNANKK